MYNPFDSNGEDWFDKMEREPGKQFAKFAALGLVVNLIFWLVIIAAAIFGLSFIL